MFKDNSSILFIGDSITDCGSSSAKQSDFVTYNGYSYLISSKLGHEYLCRNYTFVNKGINGDRIVDLYARWKRDCLNLKPDVISLLEGVNDIGFELVFGTGVNIDKFEMIYNIMLEEIKQNLPDTVIILMEPFILNEGQIAPRWEQWEIEIAKRREIIKNLAGKYKTIYVPLQEIFNGMCRFKEAKYWLYDGIHPTPAGHALIANEWLKAAEYI